MTETESVLVRMPPRVKRKLIDEINRRNRKGETLNMTSLINSILAERYNVRYSPPNKRSAPFGGGRPK